MAGKSKKEIRRLADKFLGRPTEELMGDPEFQQLTVEDVDALGAEQRPRASRGKMTAEEFSPGVREESDAAEDRDVPEADPRSDSPPVVLNDDADLTRPAALASSRRVRGSSTTTPTSTRTPSPSARSGSSRNARPSTPIFPSAAGGDAALARLSPRSR